MSYFYSFTYIYVQHDFHIGWYWHDASH